jgi:hypothetical protein
VLSHPSLPFLPCPLFHPYSPYPFSYVSQVFLWDILFLSSQSVCLSVRPSVRSSVRVKLVRPSQVKLLVGFQLNFTGVISTIPCCACTLPSRSASLFKMTARAKNRKNHVRTPQVKLLVGFQLNFIGVISTICSCALHRHIPLHCAKWPPELSIEKNPVRPSQVKLLVGFQPHFTGVISIIPWYAHQRHVSLSCTKWPPELKIEYSCPAFTCQTAGKISTNLHRSDQFHP